MISRRLMPRIAPLRKMFSRPFSSGWKPVPDLEQRSDSPAHRDPALGRRRDTRDDLEQGALAGAVPPDQADDVTLPDLEIDASERPEVLLLARLLFTSPPPWTHGPSKAF